MGLFGGNHCRVCGVEFKRTKYRVTIHGRRVFICPGCHKEVMRDHSKASVDEVRRTGKLGKPGVASERHSVSSSEAGGCGCLIIIGIAVLIWWASKGP